MKYDRREPCTTCPYRKDVAPGIWHASEYEKLRRADRDELNGGTFLCHLSSARPKSDAEFCAGWLVDQKRRGIPSIQLRLVLMADPEAIEQLECVQAPKGVDLYESIEAMCEANVGADFPDDDAKARSLKRMVGGPKKERRA